MAFLWWSVPSPVKSRVSLFHFIVWLYRRFLPCILIRIKIPPGRCSARSEDARAIGQRRRGRGLASLGCSTDSASSPKVDSDRDKRFTPIVFSPEESLPLSLPDQNKATKYACFRPVFCLLLNDLKRLHKSRKCTQMTSTEVGIQYWCPPLLSRNSERKGSRTAKCWVKSWAKNELLYFSPWHITPTIFLDTNHASICLPDLFFFPSEDMLLHSYSHRAPSFVRGDKLCLAGEGGNHV